MNWETGSFMLPPENDAANTREGIFSYSLGSNDAVQPFPAITGGKYQLKIKSRIRAGGPKNISFEKPEEMVIVKPQFILARFWVVPGIYRDTSLALAYVKMMPSNKPLENLPLRLTVLNPSGAWLSLDNCDAEQETAAVDDAMMDVYKLQKKKGVAVWTLRYSGLNWNKLSSARFEVLCEGPQGKVGPVVSLRQTIDINKNVHDLLKDLFHDPKMQTEMNNPYWKTGFSVLPAVCRGQVWNILQLGDTNRPYVCHHIRDKINGWMAARRNYQKKQPNPEAQFSRMNGMNGIEFDNYEMVFFHYYSGIFLSGCPQTDCKVLDPWWEQRWEDPALMEPENLMTHKGELWNTAKLATFVSIMATVLVEAFLAIGVKIGFASTVALIKAINTGVKYPVILTKLGLKNHIFSTYVVDTDPFLTGGAYYLSTDWFVTGLSELDRADAAKYTKPPAGS